ncbi:hypothetical protein OROMI_012350 [Orobanche minor]
MLYDRSGTDPSLADDCLLFGVVRHLSKTGFYIPTVLDDREGEEQPSGPPPPPVIPEEDRIYLSSQPNGV